MNNYLVLQNFILTFFNFTIDTRTLFIQKTNWIIFVESF